MFKKLRMKKAAKKIKRRKAKSVVVKKSHKTRKIPKKKCSFWRKVWRIIWLSLCWCGRVSVMFWRWLCRVGFVNLINLILLAAIIVLFFILIISVTNCDKKTVVVISNTKNAAVETVKSRDNVIVRPVSRQEAEILPIKRSAKIAAHANKPVKIIPVETCSVASRQIARQGNVMFGDIVLDGQNEAKILRRNTIVKGNLYLQNMRKYVLPCDVVVEGDLFLRNLNMLQFCGSFTVKGNIYVSPRSSFGPLPRTARLGGQIIL